MKDDRAIMIMYTYVLCVYPKTASHITILVAENSRAENHEVVDDGRTRQSSCDCSRLYSAILLVFVNIRTVNFLAIVL